MQFNPHGNFLVYFGANTSTTSLKMILQRTFFTEEQLNKFFKITPASVVNVAMDKQGLIYTVTGGAGNDVPLKKLSVSGLDLFGGGMVRSSEYAMVDADVDPNGNTYAVDMGGTIYEYDSNGNLLFAFGDEGTQLGNLKDIQSIVYQGDKLLVLNGTKTNMKLVVFNRTEYGDVLVEALHYQNIREYDEAIESWKEILMRNSNYDAAYVGIGQALFRSGAYEEALDYYKSAYDVENYSNAYKELRKQWMSSFFLLIPVAVIVLCILISKFFGYAAKVNKAAAVSGKKHTFKEELLFVFHLMFHPFDAFWDLKHEKRGSVRASLVFIVLAIVSMFYRSVGRGYVVNPKGEYSTIFMQAMVILLPVFLFAISNWCLTTLFEGEGSMKDIFIAACYSLAPLPLLMVPSVILSNVLAASEGQIITLLVDIAFVWMGLLLFLGMMVTHDYSMLKNVITSIGTIVGMAFIMFLAILFSSLMTKIVGFISGIIVEITYRM
jgi:hypothetical protein